MSTESIGTDPYAAVLADLRNKRAQIDQTIATLEAMSGLPVVAMAVGHSTGTSSASAVSEIVETAGMYLGMSIVDATKKLLSVRKRTMGNAEILAELRAGGLVLNSNEPLNVVSSVLMRRFKNDGDVVRVARGVWGLKEWYPGRTFKVMGKAAIPSEQPADIPETGGGVDGAGAVDLS